MLKCFHSYTTKYKLDKDCEVCKNHDYCYVEMPNEYYETLKYNHGEKSMKVLFIIYVVLEFLLEKISPCHNNPKKSSITKKDKYTASGYSLFTHCSFETAKNKLAKYRSKNCMKIFCLNLREHAIKIINYEKKEINK